MKDIKKRITVDGNTAAARIAYLLNEVIAIYPITPSSTMAEVCDAYTVQGKRNIFNTVPSVTEMQSEGGAAGAVHGALTAGALTTTFTASQGLLLMLPNMYKIAGELCPTVFHIAARALACQALSIFGDHGDVMSARSTGFAMLASANVQEAQDFAAIAQMVTLESRIPFLHFFDGFRTSHEVQKIIELSEEELKKLINQELVLKVRERGLNPEQPCIRGTSQNPDVYFQGREAVNAYYLSVPQIAEKAFNQLYDLTGRRYHCYEYKGAADAEHVIVVMGSGADTVQEYVEYATAQGSKIGLLNVRLYRPFDMTLFVQALPATVKTIAVLDRCKEPGAIGEPLYLDVRTAIGEALSTGSAPFKNYPHIVGGRYGLGSKEFTPGMVKAVFDNSVQKQPKNHFTVGINDDVTHASLAYENIDITDSRTFSGMFYGLGSDGTVGANKNSIKIIGDHTENYCQGYFVYDSKKAGALTISHLRFGPKAIRAPYLILSSDFVAVHHFSFLERYDVLAQLKEGGTFLLNSLYGPNEVWHALPRSLQKTIIDKKIRFYVIDAIAIAQRLGLGSLINGIMQTAFFEISKILERDVFVQFIKDAIKKTYGKKGEDVVNRNCQAVDETLAGLYQVSVPQAVTSTFDQKPLVSDNAPVFVKEVEALIMANKGDSIPVSKMPVDGTFPSATTQYEKRNIAVEIPSWDTALCIQCGQCSLVCPHAAIRVKIYDSAVLKQAPATFKSADAKTKEFEGKKFTVQVAPEDCTGCGSCVFNCPGIERDAEKKPTGRKALTMVLQPPIRHQERENYDFFLQTIPEMSPSAFNRFTIKGSQLIKPLFEYSGACAGCGETPYLKLLSQLYGDHLMVANATGCSSIYGGNLPTTPWSKRADGCGPAWSNSLFEDNAEFGLGMRLAVENGKQHALNLIETLIGLGSPFKKLLEEVRDADQSTQEGIEAQRSRIIMLKDTLAADATPAAKELISVAYYLVKRSNWIVGGDGWAYDIGYGGLDHVMASGKKVNVLILDTEVYSNTGGQMSKSTPRGAVAAFAMGGKNQPKKDLALMMMSYGNVYVARIALGANPNQAIKAFTEADSYDGPALIIAYAPCIAHGINMEKNLAEAKKAVQCGHWILLRYDPRRQMEGKNPLQLDSQAPTISYEEYAKGENRFNRLMKTDPALAKQFIEASQKSVTEQFKYYQALASLPV